ncbi:MAG: IS66 family transposase [Cyclobacteriaceae bacterium]|nr:IS66 family transposase [Cyclobacteriaceae bacterium]
MTNTYQQLTKEELIFKLLTVEQELLMLKKYVFGKKSERFIPFDTGQLTLDLGQVNTKEPEVIQKQVTITKTVKTKPVRIDSGRMQLPAHLPRVEHLLEPAEDTSGYKKIGEEITEELAYTPGKMYVNRFIRPKYARPENNGVVVAKLPERPIDKAIAGTSLLAQIIVDKYVYHMPLNRQAQRWEREHNVKVAMSTLTDWTGGAIKVVEPLFPIIKDKILNSGYVQVDETPIKVLEQTKKGNIHRGFYWVYYSPKTRLVMFDYRTGRGREGPAEMLKNFKGYLQVDGYAAYDQFEHKAGINLLNCMAHGRRMFVEAQNNDPDRASHFLTQIQHVYHLEKIARENHYSQEQIYQMRQQQALPILNDLYEWMVNNVQEVTPKSPIGQAIAYNLARWKNLMKYAEQGFLQIDNNLVENAIRPVALGRKNYLFAGSNEAATRAGVIYSLLATCKINEVDPLQWLNDILPRIQSYPQKQIEDLLPHRWKHLQQKEEAVLQ